eukprot:GHRQ01033120.1.p1 GENE.GHRQ01033120.1~~GHRQ01033120.1.p1  ORF type:complete len:216 (-),score=39.10 GHRQ01033120.1:30-677(-)
MVTHHSSDYCNTRSGLDDDAPLVFFLVVQPEYASLTRLTHQLPRQPLQLAAASGATSCNGLRICCSHMLLQHHKAGVLDLKHFTVGLAQQHSHPHTLSMSHHQNSLASKACADFLQGAAVALQPLLQALREGRQLAGACHRAQRQLGQLAVCSTPGAPTDQASWDGCNGFPHSLEMHVQRSEGGGCSWPGRLQHDFAPATWPASQEFMHNTCSET